MQSVVIVKHEPERRRKAVTTLHCGCCCSCCCCCLHTIGAIVGAALGPSVGGGDAARDDRHWANTYGVLLVDYWDEEGEKPSLSESPKSDGDAITASAPSAIAPPSRTSDSASSPGERRIALPALPSSVSFFWWTLCVMIFLAFAYGLTVGGSGSSFLITAIVVLMVFPLLQLASALVTGLVFACWPRPDKVYQFKQLGKITAGVVIGSLIGLAPMICFLGVITR